MTVLAAFMPDGNEWKHSERRKAWRGVAWRFLGLLGLDSLIWWQQRLVNCESSSSYVASSYMRLLLEAIERERARNEAQVEYM